MAAQYMVEGIYASQPASNQYAVPDLGLTLLPGSQTTQTGSAEWTPDRARWRLSPRVAARSQAATATTARPPVRYVPSTPNLHLPTDAALIEANKRADRLHERNRHLSYERDKYLNACDKMQAIDPVTKRPRFQVVTKTLEKTVAALQTETARATAWQQESSRLAHLYQQAHESSEAWKQQAEYWKQEAERWRLRSEISSSVKDSSVTQSSSTAAPLGLQITPPDSTRSSTPSIPGSAPSPIDLTQVSDALDVWSTLGPRQTPQEACATLKRKSYTWTNDQDHPAKQPRLAGPVRAAGQSRSPKTSNSRTGRRAKSNETVNHIPTAAEINAAMLAYEKEVEQAASNAISPLTPETDYAETEGQEVEELVVRGLKAKAQPAGGAFDGLLEGEEEGADEMLEAIGDNDDDDDWLARGLEMEDDADGEGGVGDLELEDLSDGEGPGELVVEDVEERGVQQPDTIRRVELSDNEESEEE